MSLSGKSPPPSSEPPEHAPSANAVAATADAIANLRFFILNSDVFNDFERYSIASGSSSDDPEPSRICRSWKLKEPLRDSSDLLRTTLYPSSAPLPHLCRLTTVNNQSICCVSSRQLPRLLLHIRHTAVG